MDMVALEKRCLRGPLGTTLSNLGPQGAYCGKAVRLRFKEMYSIKQFRIKEKVCTEVLAQQRISSPWLRAECKVGVFSKSLSWRP